MADAGRALHCAAAVQPLLSSPRPAAPQALALGLESPPWHLFILLLSGFTLFAGPVAHYLSAPDGADAWIDGFLIAGMAIFVTEVVLNVLCQ